MDFHHITLTSVNQCVFVFILHLACTVYKSVCGVCSLVIFLKGTVTVLTTTAAPVSFTVPEYLLPVPT